MKKNYILNTCDAWHSHSSKEVVAVYSTKKKAINGASLWSSNHQRVFGSEDVEELERIGQTQGKDVNFLIEEYSVNPITV